MSYNAPLLYDLPPLLTKHDIEVTFLEFTGLPRLIKFMLQKENYNIIHFLKVYGENPPISQNYLKQITYKFKLPENWWNK